MGRSQRHRLLERGETSNAEVHAQGVTAPGLIMQVDPSNPNVLRQSPDRPGHLNALEDVEIPMGAQGGPLQGSSLTGPIPESMLPPPEPADNITLGSLDPDTAVMGGADLTLRCIGTNFDDSCVIVFNDGDETTTFVSETELTTGVKPSLVGAAIEVMVLVRRGDGAQSEQLPFTFTDVATRGARIFPKGPYNILHIKPDPDGASYVLSSRDAKNVHVGDDITVEATGSSTLNGDFVVAKVNQTSIVVEGLTVTTQIDAKGRLTVNSG